MKGKLDGRSGDYIKLGQAVAAFNRKRSKLIEENPELDFLPDRQVYQDVKNRITTRKELNRVLKSLRTFTKTGNEELIVLDSGQKLTVWEYGELQSLRKRANQRLKAEYQALAIPKKGEKYSRLQMGSERAKEITGILNKIWDLENRTGWDFKRAKWSIEKQGVSDYTMRKAIIFRQNYLKVMERYSNLDNYDLLMAKLNSINNPLQFYEFVSQNELTGDLTYVSDQTFTQQAFNSFLIRLGFDVEDTITKEYELHL